MSVQQLSLIENFDAEASFENQIRAKSFTQTPFTFIDLFAGIGGFRIALDALGGKCLAFSEIDKNCILTYMSNYKDTDKNLGDITKIEDIEHVDMLVGGVPCQSWSVAGKMLGFDDARGALWYDVIRLVKISKPKTFIFENVKGLYDPRNKKNLDFIMEHLTKQGYLVRHKLLNSYDYGVPQIRTRIFIEGFVTTFLTLSIISGFQ